MAIVKNKKTPPPPKEKRKRDTSRHDALVKAAGKWLKGTCNCGVVMEEPKCGTGENPDAIGFSYTSKRTILVECKTSRADFMREKKKFFRQPGYSRDVLGGWRFYLVDEMFVTEDDIPENWGLYFFDGKRVIHKFGVKLSNMSAPPFTSSVDTERSLLYYLLKKSNLRKSNVN